MIPPEMMHTVVLFFSSRCIWLSAETVASSSTFSNYLIMLIKFLNRMFSRWPIFPVASPSTIVSSIFDSFTGMPAARLYLIVDAFFGCTAYREISLLTFFKHKANPAKRAPPPTPNTTLSIFFSCFDNSIAIVPWSAITPGSS